MSRVGPRTSRKNLLHLLGGRGVASSVVQAPDLSLMLVAVVVARGEVYKLAKRLSGRMCSWEGGDGFLVDSSWLGLVARRRGLLYLFLYLYLH